jgi:ABC-2 type transport system ATP-binding protein
MRQRLGLAAALLGDPATLLLDEPMNGLDPEGIVWLRSFVRRLADEGRTVFLSSHLMTEMAMTADHLVVIRDGRMVTDSSMAEVLAEHSHQHVVVRAPHHQEQLGALIGGHGGLVTVAGDGSLTATGLAAAAVGEIAAAAGIALEELTTVASSLEDAFIEMTHARAADLVGAAPGA